MRVVACHDRPADDNATEVANLGGGWLASAEEGPG